MTELVLSEFKALSGSDHIVFKLWGVVIFGLLSWVKWWILEDKVPVMTNDFLSDWEIFIVVNDISINTKIYNWVVLVVTWILLWVFVLVATSR